MPKPTSVAFCLSLSLALGSVQAAAQTEPATPAVAGDAPPDAARLEESREQYRRGVAAFRAGHFGDAVLAFEHSFHLRPHPNTLYNAAEARLRGGDRERAVEQLRQLLAMTSPAPDAQIVERARALAHEAGVDDLQPAESHQVACPTCPTCATQRECPTCPPATGHVEREHGVLPYVLAAGGIVLVGVGMGFYGNALGDAYAYANLPDGTNQSSLDSIRSQGETFRAVGLTGLILGLAAEAGAVYLFMHPSPVAHNAATTRTAPRPMATLTLTMSSIGVVGTF